MGTTVCVPAAETSEVVVLTAENILKKCYFVVLTLYQDRLGIPPYLA